MSNEDIKTTELKNPLDPTNDPDKVPNNPETTFALGSEVIRDEENNLDIRKGWTVVEQNEEFVLWRTPAGLYKEYQTEYGRAKTKVEESENKLK